MANKGGRRRSSRGKQSKSSTTSGDVPQSAGKKQRSPAAASTPTASSGRRRSSAGGGSAERRRTSRRLQGIAPGVHVLAGPQEMRRCRWRQHTAWFPSLPQLQHVSAFDIDLHAPEGRSRCCTKCAARKRRRQEEEAADEEWQPEGDESDVGVDEWERRHKTLQKVHGATHVDTTLCAECGEAGHTKHSCSVDVPEEMKACRGINHLVWFPDIPRLRPRDCFQRNGCRADKLMPQCAECSRKGALLVRHAKAADKGKSFTLPACATCGQTGHAASTCTSKNQIPADMKRCSCGKHEEWFPEIPRIRERSCFGRNSQAKDGLTYRCKECHRTYINHRNNPKIKANFYKQG